MIIHSGESVLIDFLNSICEISSPADRGVLMSGYQVIIQGTANLKDGAPIKPVPASSPQRVKAPPPDVLKKMNANRRGGG